MCGREYYYYYYCREVYRVRLRVRTFPLKLAGVALELPETMLVAVLAASASALTLTSVGRVSMPRTRPRATGATSAATFTEAAQTGDWRAAMALLEAQAAPANASSFAKTISACGKAGRHAEALALMSQMRAAGHEPDTWTCNAVMAACGEWPAALETLNEMSESTWAPPDVSSFVMIEMLAQGQKKRHGDDSDSGSGGDDGKGLCA